MTPMPPSRPSAKTLRTAGAILSFGVVVLLVGPLPRAGAVAAEGDFGTPRATSGEGRYPGEAPPLGAGEASSREGDHATPTPATTQLFVGPGETYTTITAALAAAEPGARILVREGVYREPTLRIQVPLTLVGEGFPVLDSDGTSSVMEIEADDVEIRGLHLRGAAVSHVADNAAIRVGAVSGCRIEGNRLEDNFFGVYLARSRDCRVVGNIVRASGTRESTSGNGIHLWNATDVLVEANEITGHRDGIYLEFARGAVIRGNTSVANLRYGMHFMFSDESEYTGNTFRSNGAGVAVMYTKRVTMRDNLFDDNWGPAAYGLLLKEISDSRIEGNTFRRNTVGIYAEGTAGNVVTNNDFVRNGWGVRMRSNSRDNRFTRNNFIDNSFEVATDSRQHRNHFEGNYWSRYDGYDLTGDGIGDVPHRPVRLFAVIVERTPAAMVLLRTFFVDLLDLAERVMPALTPETLIDEKPSLREVRR